MGVNFFIGVMQGVMVIWGGGDSSLWGVWPSSGGELATMGGVTLESGMSWQLWVNLVDIIQTTGFAQSLSNFTCKLLMTRGGTLLIFKSINEFFRTLYVKSCGHYTDNSFYPISFKNLLNVQDERRNKGQSILQPSYCYACTFKMVQRLCFCSITLFIWEDESYWCTIVGSKGPK